MKSAKVEGAVKPALRILVVDDHTLFAEAMCATLARLDGPSVQIASSAEEAMTQLKVGRFDLILLDLGLPKLRGRAAFEAIRSHAGDTPIVLVTASEPSAEILRLIREGARGCVHKRARSEELLGVLRFVLGGGTHVPPELLQLPAGEGDEINLSPRQREVLVMLARGLCNKDIANALGIAEATVRVHVSSVMRILDVENRTQAATSAYARRLLD